MARALTGSRAHWRQTHRAYFQRVLKNDEDEVNDDLLIAFEEFEVVFPPIQNAALD